MAIKSIIICERCGEARRCISVLSIYGDWYRCYFPYGWRLVDRKLFCPACVKSFEKHIGLFLSGMNETKIENKFKCLLKTILESLKKK